MEVFLKAMEAFAAVPAWVPFIVLPALVAVAAALFTALGGRKAYPATALILGAAGTAITCAKAGADGALFYAGLFAAFSAALGFLFLIPVPKRGRGARPKNKDEMIYQKFRLDLTEKPYTQERSDKPPKVCCFEDAPATVTAEESGLKLDYAKTLLKRLGEAKLNAGDRLEADSLSHTLLGFEKKQLTATELRALNDCLASVLKLTAKYKL